MVNKIALFKNSGPRGIREISIYYTLVSSASGVFAFLPKYLEQGARLSVERIGVVQAVGPLVAIFVPVLWGMIADKSKSRNTVWIAILCGLAVSVFFFAFSQTPLLSSPGAGAAYPMNGRSPQFIYIVCALACISMFQASLPPMADSVCTEICADKK